MFLILALLLNRATFLKIGKYRLTTETNFQDQFSVSYDGKAWMRRPVSPLSCMPALYKNRLIIAGGGNIIEYSPQGRDVLDAFLDDVVGPFSIALANNVIVANAGPHDVGMASQYRSKDEYYQQVMNTMRTVGISAKTGVRLWSVPVSKGGEALGPISTSKVLCFTEAYSVSHVYSQDEKELVFNVLDSNGRTTESWRGLCSGNSSFSWFSEILALSYFSSQYHRQGSNTVLTLFKRGNGSLDKLGTITLTKTTAIIRFAKHTATLHRNW